MKKVEAVVEDGPRYMPQFVVTERIDIMKTGREVPGRITKDCMLRAQECRGELPTLIKPGLRGSRVCGEAPKGVRPRPSFGALERRRRRMGCNRRRRGDQGADNARRKVSL